MDTKNNIVGLSISCFFAVADRKAIVSMNISWGVWIRPSFIDRTRANILPYLSGILFRNLKLSRENISDTGDFPESLAKKSTKFINGLNGKPSTKKG
jgi:hypothetical protein